ncbi:MAG: hypothetical protein ICV34_03935 [Rubrobacter sp.]|nr:hypothetical protein [Rubrobacter sp.]
MRFKPIAHSVATSVVPGGTHGLRVNVELKHVCSGARGENAVDPAAGAHVEHPVARTRLGHDRLVEQVIHTVDRLYLAQHLECNP